MSHSGRIDAANTLFTYMIPVAAPIPTLSEWAMIFMASLMGLFAFARIRRQSWSDSGPMTKPASAGLFLAEFFCRKPPLCAMGVAHAQHNKKEQHCPELA